MTIRTILTFLSGAVVAFALMTGVFMLDRTVLHIVYDDTLWYYVDVDDAGRLTRSQGTGLISCDRVLTWDPAPIRTSSHAPPRRLGDIERVAIECSK